MHALRLAVSEIVIHRTFKLGPQAGHGLSMEADDAPDAEQTPDKNVVSLVVLDARGIAPMRHGVHGVTPTRSSSSRASSTW